MVVSETNLICDAYWNVKDHQARVIEVPDWKEYTKLFENYNLEAKSCGDYKSVYHTMEGFSLPEDAMMLDCDYDDYHLTCKMITHTGYNIMKLINIIKD